MMSRSDAGKLGFLKTKHLHEERSRKFKEAYDSKPKQCKSCNVAISFEKRRNEFCSRTCSAAWNNKGRAHKGTCKTCGVTVNKGYTYCSHACHQKQLFTEFIERWQTGVETGGNSNGMSVSAYIKRWLRENRGNKCQSCGWNEVNPVTNKVPLQVDHVDGNAENNREDNLRLLCPNCHSLTPTFGSLNKGKGRKYRYLQKRLGSTKAGALLL